MALAVIGGLFLLVGVQSMTFADIANDTMIGNSTNATAMGNATSVDNQTGKISKQVGNVKYND